MIPTILLILSAGMTSSCGSTALEPQPWNQVHAEPRNSGFNAVHSPVATSQAKMWSAPVGPISLSSPAIGPNGTVYIGNIMGEAVAVNPDGTQRWRYHLGASIVAPPAVDTETEKILYVVQNPVTPTEYLSFLYRLSPEGKILTVSTEQNLSTTAAPKIWRGFVFLQTGVRYSSGSDATVARYYVYVFDRISLQVVAKTAPGCGQPICGHGPEWFEIFKDFVKCLASFPIPVECGASYVGRTDGPKQDPSVAIVDARNVAGDPNRPIVVAATGFCAAALRFDPSAAFDQRLTQLWGHKLVGDCENPVLCTSPSVIAGTQAVFGDGKGRVMSFDAGTGAQLWQADESYPVKWPPVAYLRQIYVVTSQSVIEHDSDGTVLHRSFPQGSGHAAAQSLDHLHVTTSAGLYTFGLNLLPNLSFDAATADSGDFVQSTPVLGKNGTLYVSTPSGFIHAYGPGSP